ncbi:MAG: acyltransferase [Gammaproteobacteria bacterium]
MNGEIRALTGLRGLAIVFVLLSHANKAGFLLFEQFDFSGGGRYGVFIFFILSSFLLTRQFLVLGVGCSFRAYIPEYLMKRFLRIYPLFITTLLVYYAFHVFGHTIWVFDGWDLLRNMLLLEGVGVFWVIPVEFQYYFFIPFISVLLLKYYDSFIGVSVFSIAFIVLYSLVVDASYQSNVGPFLAIFYMGSFLAYLQDKLDKLKLSERGYWYLTKCCNVLSFICLAVFVTLVPKYFGHIVGDDNIPVGYFHNSFILLGVLSSIFIFTVINSKGLIEGILASRFFNFVGKVSFSAYLGHYLILAAISKYSEVFLPEAAFVVFFLFTFLFSFISFRLIEEPLYRLGHKKRV